MTQLCSRYDERQTRWRALSSRRALVKLARMTPGTHDMTSLDYYGIEELLTEEERAARDGARRFVQEEVLREIVPFHRAGKFPEHLIPRMGALGFYAPYLKGDGCPGLSYTAYGLIMQELERADSRSEEHTSELQSLAYLVC